MGKHVIITGSSGMVGRGVLLECLDSPMISKVLILNRQAIGVDHEKLTEIILPDFFQLDEIKNKLSGYDACFFCAGVSAVGKTEADYKKVTHDLTLNFAKIFLEMNKAGMFCYVSGAGTDNTEKGHAMWARVKGKTENDLLKMPFKNAYMFRPGYIQPLRGIKSKTRLYSLLYAIFRPLYHILKHFPNAATNTSQVGQAMIYVAVNEPEFTFLDNRLIKEFAKLNLNPPSMRN